MPKKNLYPGLHTRTKRGKAGQVYTYYTYDMRAEGKPDLNLGSDRLDAIDKWKSLKEGQVIVRGRIQEAIGRWRAEELKTYTNRNTRNEYAKHLNRLEPVFGMAAWHEVTLPVLRQYLDKRTAKTQANRELALLSIVWKKALMWGMTERSWPATGIKGWKNKEQAREFEVTDELFNSVYQFADRILKSSMDMSTATGMRITDAITVRVPANGVLRHKHHKTGKYVEFDLSQSPVLTLMAEQRSKLRATSLMFLVNDDGQAVTYAMLRKRWLRAQSEAMEAYPDIAAEIKTMYLRDMRKRAADLAGSLDEATELLQHSNKGLTSKHYRTKATKLKAVR